MGGGGGGLRGFLAEFYLAGEIPPEYLVFRPPNYISDRMLGPAQLQIVPARSPTTYTGNPMYLPDDFFLNQL
jgi:hypothetical protein